MHYEQQQLKYAGLHFQPVFHKLFYKLPISKQNCQVIFYQITIAIYEISDFISIVCYLVYILDRMIMLGHKIPDIL